MELKNSSRVFIGYFNSDLPGNSFDDFLHLYLYGHNSVVNVGKDFRPHHILQKQEVLLDLKKLFSLTEGEIKKKLINNGFYINIDTDDWKPPSHTFKGCLAYMIDKLEQSIKDDLGNRSVNN